MNTNFTTRTHRVTAFVAALLVSFVTVQQLASYGLPQAAEPVVTVVTVASR